MATNVKRSAPDNLESDRLNKKVADTSLPLADGDRDSGGFFKGVDFIVSSGEHNEKASLDELLAIAGELSIARLHEQHAKQEVDRFKAAERDSERIFTYPSFVELQQAARDKAEAALSYWQDTIKSLSERAKSYRTAIDHGFAVRDESFVSRMTAEITGVIENKICSKLQQTDVDIHTMKSNLEKSDELMNSQGVLYKKEIDTLKTVVGNLHRNHNDRLKQHKHEYETTLASVKADIEAVTQSYYKVQSELSIVQQVSALAQDIRNHKASTVDFQIKWAAELSRIDQQMTYVEQHGESIRGLLKTCASLTEELQPIKGQLTMYQNDVSTKSAQSEYSATYHQNLAELKDEITELKKTIGNEGDEGVSGIWSFVNDQFGHVGEEDGHGRTGLWGYIADVGFSGREGNCPTGLFAAVAQLQEIMSKLDHNGRQDTNTKEIVAVEIEGLRVKFDQVLKDVMQQQTATTNEVLTEHSNKIALCIDAIDSYHVLDQTVEIQFSHFEKLIFKLTDQLCTLEKRITAELLLSNSNIIPTNNTSVEVRLKSLEDKGGVSQHTAEQCRQTPPIQALSSICEVKLAELRTEIDVLAEVCRSLEDRYNNTTSEGIIQAMCYEFNARYGFQAYLGQINGTAQTVGKLNSDLVQVKQKVKALDDDLSNRTAGLEKAHNEQRASVTGLLYKYAETSEVGNTLETLKNQMGDIVKQLEVSLHRWEKLSSMMTTVQVVAQSSTTKVTTLECAMSKSTSQLAEFAQRRDDLENRVAGFESRFEYGQKQLADLIQQRDSIGYRIGDLESQLEHVEKQITALESHRTLDVEENKRKFSTTTDLLHKYNEEAAGKAALVQAVAPLRNLIDTLTQKVDTVRENVTSNKHIRDEWMSTSTKSPVLSTSTHAASIVRPFLQKPIADQSKPDHSKITVVTPRASQVHNEVKQEAIAEQSSPVGRAPGRPAKKDKGKGKDKKTSTKRQQSETTSDPDIIEITSD